ncbi:hypothetical protein LOZ53_005579 [Ophidiomyces ophidiicola]|nr:hypothetical protein LOZ55_006292 [Ophidiomyces ophidiicola]KAI1984120.1 hypothetical protein LOZ53_005579 [Ophidiomyces ophidiicola]KAI1984540.1 hypothetical protein LOZ51_006618 [Ophidiomyces ophidiicola]KAI1987814.1 hypothetical protein LOZ54_003409 [Ophidiomyces ophidiicola]
MKKRSRTAFKSKRDMDSGVWMMGSDDGSTLSSDPIVPPDSETILGNSGQMEDEFTEDVCACSAACYRFPSPIMSEDTGTRRGLIGTAEGMETEAQRHVRSAVNHCLEEGKDNVDLSCFYVETIPPDVLQSLAQLTRVPVYKKSTPFPQQFYVALEPFLRLYLAHNRLFELPRELFELSGLKLLSLRQNKLREVPSAIRNLTRLLDFNVAANRLEHLPWELIGLMRSGTLKRLTVHPNPFIQLRECDISHWHWELEEGDRAISKRLRRNPSSADDTPSLQAWRPLHIATSSIKYLNMDGQLLHTGDSNSFQLTCTRAPSLRELSLQACLRSPKVSNFLSGTTDDCPDLPPFVLQLMQVAKATKRTGDRVCSVCGRLYIIPRVEWVEWWDCSPHENGSKIARVGGERLWPLPFIRRTCSWACQPDFRRDNNAMRTHLV